MLKAFNIKKQYQPLFPFILTINRSSLFEKTCYNPFFAWKPRSYRLLLALPGNILNKLFCFLWYCVLHSSKSFLFLYRKVERIAIKYLYN